MFLGDLLERLPRVRAEVEQRLRRSDSRLRLKRGRWRGGRLRGRGRGPWRRGRCWDVGYKLDVVVGAATNRNRVNKCIDVLGSGDVRHGVRDVDLAFALRKSDICCERIEDLDGYEH